MTFVTFTNTEANFSKTYKKKYFTLIKVTKYKKYVLVPSTSNVDEN